MAQSAHDGTGVSGLIPLSRSLHRFIIALQCNAMQCSAMHSGEGACNRATMQRALPRWWNRLPATCLMMPGKDGNLQGISPANTEFRAVERQTVVAHAIDQAGHPRRP